MNKLKQTTIEIYKDRSGDLRWRATFRKKILAASSEGYKSRVGLEKALERVFRKGWQAVYIAVDTTRKAAS